MQFNPQVLDRLAEELHAAGYLITRSEFNDLVQKIDAQTRSTKGKGSNFENHFSISRAIRGLSAAAGHVIASESREADINYAQRTMLTGTTPGSYLVPTIQADQIIQLLTSANVIRAAGARIWPMTKIQKLNVPQATASPTISWGDGSGNGAGAQGAQLTPSDPGIGQISFDLKSAKALTAVPNELLAVSLPAVDQVVSEILSLSFAQEEMNAMVATTVGTGKPGTIYAASGTTTYNANANNANGGAVKYADLLQTVGKFYAAKGKGKPCWFMHPTVFYADIMGIVDSQGRPIVTGQDNVEQPFDGRLLGFPVFVSAEFPTNQAVGSGSNQSYAVFTNPAYIQIGDGSFELSVSFERFFDSNETAIRGIHRVDYGYAPAAAIVLLKGINV